MNMKKRTSLLDMMAFSAMSDNPMIDHLDHEHIVIQPRPPKGTKEYWFNKEGGFSSEQMLKSEVVFTCYAINDKNAIKKFNRWNNE